MESQNSKTKIEYPYLPEGKMILYVPASNKYMLEAKEYARTHSLDKVMPNASILVKGEKVIGRGANGSNYHDLHGCERVRRGIPTGEGYELCEGCHPKNHGEPKAIKDAEENRESVEGADIYLWGHWWCCEPCWNRMIRSGVKNVYLLEGSEILFNKSAPGNIVGHQFE